MNPSQVAAAAQYGLRVEKPKAIPVIESSPWFWHPGRFGIQMAPSWFRRKLDEIDPELEACWNGHEERWAIWMKKPKLQTPLCQGWQLLFLLNEPDGSYAPLDERTLARLFMASGARWGTGRQYFAAIEREMERDKAAREAASIQASVDVGWDQMEFKKIKNIGKGNKFSSFEA